MDLDALSRPQLQQLCKEHNIKANLSSKELIALLSSHLAAHPQQSPIAERTRASRASSSDTPFVPPPANSNSSTPATRSRDLNRRSRASSRSTSTTTAAVVPEPEEAGTVESEKENKHDNVRRKARESQKRLGVGKPRAAGGMGARTVTRIVPSRSGAPGSRTRSRTNLGEEPSRMDVVIEEDGEDQPQSPIRQHQPEASRSSTQTVVAYDTSSITHRIAAIEAQIAQLFVARDSLLSKQGSHERDFGSIRDDIAADRGKIVDEAAKLAESRLAMQLLEAHAERKSLMEALEKERSRVATLEKNVDALVKRLDAIESRASFPQPILEDSEELHPAVPPKGAHSPLVRKRPASPSDNLPGPSSPARASKRARHGHESHAYSTAARLENALAHPISPASAPATSVPPTIPTVPETPRTPPMTRNRRTLVHPPTTPPGESMTPAQMRMVGAMPSSPTTDSPRKGMKWKGKEPATLILASPVKGVKKPGQSSKPSAKEPTSSLPPPAVTAPPIPTASSMLGGVSTPQKIPPTRSDNITRAPSSPAFPVYEPPSRLSRRGAGTGLGLGRPPPIRGAADSPVPLPGGLLPAFSLSERSAAIAHIDDDSNPATPALSDIPTTDALIAPQRDPLTPNMSGIGMGIGMDSIEHSWGGVNPMTSPEDGLSITPDHPIELGPSTSGPSASNALDWP
ncbi:hypothetical protein DL93DRAFT_198703 [Clavulina sp. PMI_390]|nr:hypothetical protein DL93DRAFT_198703 [Clavulina sp. PMI_390]